MCFVEKTRLTTTLCFLQPRLRRILPPVLPLFEVEEALPTSPSLSYLEHTLLASAAVTSVRATEHSAILSENPFSMPMWNEFTRPRPSRLMKPSKYLLNAQWLSEPPYPYVFVSPTWYSNVSAGSWFPPLPSSPYLQICFVSEQPFPTRSSSREIKKWQQQLSGRHL